MDRYTSLDVCCTTHSRLSV